MFEGRQHKGVLMNKQLSMSKVQSLTVLALMTALVVLLQLTLNIQIGPATCTMVLIPIVVGAAMLGPLAGAWLGLVFSIVVMLQPGTALFYSFGVAGTIITIIVKGTVAGLVSGLVYRAIAKKNKILASYIAAIICPVINTGIFIIGMMVFYSNSTELLNFAKSIGYDNAFTCVVLGMAGLNFLLELGVDVILAPVIHRLADLGNSMFGKKLAKH